MRSCHCSGSSGLTSSSSCPPQAHPQAAVLLAGVGRGAAFGCRGWVWRSQAGARAPVSGRRGGGRLPMLLLCVPGGGVPPASGSLLSWTLSTVPPRHPTRPTSRGPVPTPHRVPPLPELFGAVSSVRGQMAGEEGLWDRPPTPFSPGSLRSEDGLHRTHRGRKHVLARAVALAGQPSVPGLPPVRGLRHHPGVDRDRCPLRL